MRSVHRCVATAGVWPQRWRSKRRRGGGSLRCQSWVVWSCWLRRQQRQDHSVGSSTTAHENTMTLQHEYRSEYTPCEQMCALVARCAPGPARSRSADQQVHTDGGNVERQRPGCRAAHREPPIASIAAAAAAGVRRRQRRGCWCVRSGRHGASRDPADALSAGPLCRPQRRTRPRPSTPAPRCR